MPSFAEEYKRLRRRLLDEAVSDLQAASGEAVKTLRQNLSAAKASDQIRAAMGILDMAFRARELWDLAEKLAEIESRLEDLQK